MLPELISGLSSASRREMSRNLFPGFWERGISANNALKELQNLGLGYNRQNFLNDFRQGLSDYDLSSSIKHVAGAAVPSEDILQPLYHGVPDRYSFVFRVDGSDPQTGEDTSRYFFYHTNSLQSRDQLEQQAMDWLSETVDSGGNDRSGAPINIDTVTAVQGFINPVWS